MAMNDETYWLYGFADQVVKENNDLNKRVQEQTATILELRSQLGQAHDAIDILLYEIVSEDLTTDQTYNACMSYRHDYGLLEEDARWKVAWQCREWARSILRAIHNSKSVQEIKERNNNEWRRINKAKL